MGMAEFAAKSLGFDTVCRLGYSAAPELSVHLDCDGLPDGGHLLCWFADPEPWPANCLSGFHSDFRGTLVARATAPGMACSDRGAARNERRH
jgi:hypothetical protein